MVVKEKVKEKSAFGTKQRREGDFTQNKVKDGSRSESKAEPHPIQGHSPRRPHLNDSRVL